MIEWSLPTEEQINELLSFAAPGAIEVELRRLISMCAILRDQRDRAERAQAAYLLEIRKLAQEIAALREARKPVVQERKGRAG